MIIICPCEQKKFNIDDKLIPNKGRLVKCGTCNHTWFFKPNEVIERQQANTKSDTDNNIEGNIEFKKTIKDNDTNKIDNDDIKTNKKYLPAIKKEKNKNFSKNLLVSLISIIALIVLIDTFKGPLSFIIPNLNFYLDNLYQSLIDIRLFTINLFN
tara:strand:+ start:136 stop:600 length:465 start_codon:yes stop_codon:yes gene_type:complete